MKEYIVRLSGRSGDTVKKGKLISCCCLMIRYDATKWKKKREEKKWTSANIFSNFYWEPERNRSSDANERRWNRMTELWPIKQELYWKSFDHFQFLKAQVPFNWIDSGWVSFQLQWRSFIPTHTSHSHIYIFPNSMAFIFPFFAYLRLRCWIETVTVCFITTIYGGCTVHLIRFTFWYLFSQFIYVLLYVSIYQYILMSNDTEFVKRRETINRFILLLIASSSSHITWTN